MGPILGNQAEVFGLGAGDLATWVAALGTVGALFAALWQIRTERRQRLHREALDRALRHESQARLVAAAMGPEELPGHEGGLGRTEIDLFNSSDEPVYRLVIGIVFLQGTGPPTLEELLEQRRDSPPVPVTTASVLPPGTFRIWISGTGWASVLSGRAGAEMAFTDREGNWIRRASGRLEEIQEDPLDYFVRHGLYAPFDLASPERIQTS